MPALIDLLEFNIAQASVSLWVCRGPNGSSTDAPKYTSRWVPVTPGLSNVLKEIITAQRGSIEDVQEYDLLAAPLKGGALSITTDETHAEIITNLILAQTQEKKVRSAQDLYNVAFYVIKLVHEDNIIYAFRKTDGIWKTKKAFSVNTVVFRENELTIDNEPRFDISNSIDFFVVGDNIMISHKGHFESILRYKQAHKDDFIALQAEAEFIAIFENLAPLVSHVGENKIQLRRASAIRQKAHYRNDEFMERLRLIGPQYGFTIAFGADGQIISTAETCAQIMTALLDHRLTSVFSTRTYDVPSTTVVAL